MSLSRGPALLLLAFAAACGQAGPSPTATPTGTAPAPTTAAPTPGLPDEPPPAGATREFSTDFSLHSVPYSEILSGGPPKDGIPAIDNPVFIPVSQVDTWLRPAEPVILVEAGGEAKAYPIQILMWHEIVNDTVGGVPLVVTFCPLCNTAIAFERLVGGEPTTFGTTGRLRFSNLIMYDRLTESWWQQATGEAIAGERTGDRLAFHPAAIISWQEFKDAFPDGLVLSRETGYARSYGRNPYAGYDDVNASPFLYRGPGTPGPLPPMARVLTVELGGEAVAYPYDLLAELGAVNDTVGGLPVAVFWQAGTVSPLDADSTAGGRKVGTAVAYSGLVEGQALTFSPEEDGFVDDQTGSTWNSVGLAVGGPLAGARLTPIATAINHFWFSWAAFRPDTRVYAP
jgi:hypothetical protein